MCDCELLSYTNRLFLNSTQDAFTKIEICLCLPVTSNCLITCHNENVCSQILHEVKEARNSRCLILTQTYRPSCPPICLCCGIGIYTTWQKLDNKPSQTLINLKYFATTPTNQNSIHKETNSRLSSGNACYNPVQNLSSPFLPKKH
jgi:hypothetical protein